MENRLLFKGSQSFFKLKYSYESIGVRIKFNELKHKLELEFSNGGVSEMFDWGPYCHYKMVDAV